MKKIVFLAFVLVLLSTATVVGFVRVAEETIYIKADGSVVGTDKIQRDGNIYTFTANINDPMVVERDNIVIDGAGYTLQGTGSEKGIDLTGRSNVTIKNMEIKQFVFGIYLNHSSSNNIIENDFISITFECIRLYESSNNSIVANNLILNDVDGITLYGSSNNNITKNYLMSNYDGIRLYESSNNSITENIVIENYYGIFLASSSVNNIINNNVTANHGTGISLVRYSNENKIVKNHIASNNLHGMRLNESSNNHIYHNNFVDNIEQVHNINSTNVWDDGYPSGGNYWSNYTGADADYDGIGDTVHVLDGNNQDNYPLMGMFYDFTVEMGLGQIYHVYVISNSTVSNLQVLWWLTSPNEYLQPGQPLIQLYVTGEEGSIGFCRIMIPRVVLNDSYVVLIWWEYQLGAWKLIEIPSIELPISNSTHAYIYFAYTHPLIFDGIMVTIPEFPAWSSILLILIVLTVAIAVYKRRLLKQF